MTASGRFPHHGTQRGPLGRNLCAPTLLPLGCPFTERLLNRSDLSITDTQFFRSAEGRCHGLRITPQLSIPFSISS